MISRVFCVRADCAPVSVDTAGLLGPALASASGSLALVWIIFEGVRFSVATTLFTKLTFSSSGDNRKNEAGNNIVSYQYIATSHRYVAEFCDSLDRAAITERATRWKSTAPARTEERGVWTSSSSTSSISQLDAQPVFN